MFKFVKGIAQGMTIASGVKDIIPTRHKEPNQVTNGQQVFFHAPRGTTEVVVIGNNQDDIVSTWKGHADGNGSAFTKNWWFKGGVEIRYVLKGRWYVKTVYVPGRGEDKFHVYT
ncbi:MAG: hypothetical protein DSM106950_44320 [Stigonema ocellatum SAG 48.90 = DSM 106950]|nr:hypothetical protein [Stigonema ocellatum SAG 48.90 = DSM 106950]